MVQSGSDEVLGLRPLGRPCLGESRRFRPLARRDGFRPRRVGTAVRCGQALALESERDSQGLGLLEGEALLETELFVRGRPEVAAVGHLPTRPPGTASLSGAALLAVLGGALPKPVLGAGVARLRLGLHL